MAVAASSPPPAAAAPEVSDDGVEMAELAREVNTLKATLCSGPGKAVVNAVVDKHPGDAASDGVPTESVGVSSVAWLRRALGTALGTAHLYERLQERVEKGGFVEHVVEAAAEGATEAVLDRCFPRAHPNGGSSGVGDDAEAFLETFSTDFEAAWKTEQRRQKEAERGVTEPNVTPRNAMLPESSEISEDWQMVEREDVLDAMAVFIAAFVAQQPQAKHLQPEQLQRALAQAFVELRKSKVRMLWEWGTTIWRLGAMSYGAFSVYTNPWVVRAVLQATWCASKLAIGVTCSAIGLL